MPSRSSSLEMGWVRGTALAPVRFARNRASSPGVSGQTWTSSDVTLVNRTGSAPSPFASSRATSGPSSYSGRRSSVRASPFAAGAVCPNSSVTPEAMDTA